MSFSILAARIDVPKSPPATRQRWLWQGKRESSSFPGPKWPWPNGSTDQEARKKKKKKSSVILSDNQVESCLLLRAVSRLNQPEEDLQGGRTRNGLPVISRKGVLRDSYQPGWVELDAPRAGLVLQHKLPNTVAHSRGRELRGSQFPITRSKQVHSREISRSKPQIQGNVRGPIQPRASVFGQDSVGTSHSCTNHCLMDGCRQPFLPPPRPPLGLSSLHLPQ